LLSAKHQVMRAVQKNQSIKSINQSVDRQIDGLRMDGWINQPTYQKLQVYFRMLIAFSIRCT